MAILEYQKLYDQRIKILFVRLHCRNMIAPDGHLDKQFMTMTGTLIPICFSINTIIYKSHD
ncbi:hypothetical protein DERF_008983 [Dermatophagoides farinae]|uniref:Uncharacterized protein n=1 Tax=Dermatophagoides farinae TaxID=6954 RepID=A0A922HTZ0_DERFA|nr:hypothetical protein DERF_008983 [Dermatophagoides farinae]